MDRPTVFFIHLPKTAGTSMRAALEQVLGGADRLFWIGVTGAMDDLEALGEAALQRYAVIGGHAGVADFDRLRNSSRRAVYATLLREPVARAVSLFEFIVAGGGAVHPLRDELRELGLMRALVESPGFRSHIANAQCSMVGGEPTFDAAHASLLGRRWIAGTMDDGQRVLDGIAGALGARSAVLGTENEGRPGYFDRLANAEIAEAIAELNREDAKLYDFVARKAPARGGGRRWPLPRWRFGRAR
jgi:hypothetical protein